MVVLSPARPVLDYHFNAAICTTMGWRRWRGAGSGYFSGELQGGRLFIILLHSNGSLAPHWRCGSGPRAILR